MKEINGFPTIWVGKATKWWQRIIYRLYSKYINIPYIPPNSAFLIAKYPNIANNDGISYIRISYKSKLGTGYFEEYLSSAIYNIELKK